MADRLSFCPHCGAELPDEGCAFCPECGSSVSGGANPYRPAASPN
ncbi:MAG: zinc-ribbon domain-containing protein, partial [Candidatus Methanomethylophilaceae archaeon]